MASSDFVSARVNVENLREVRRALAALGADLSQLNDVNAMVADFIIGYAKSRAPRRTGRLADTMRASRARSRVSILAGNAQTPYAGPIHWGWPTRPKGGPKKGLWGGPIEANPWISEAAAALEPSWSQLYATELQKLVNRAERRASE